MIAVILPAHNEETTLEWSARTVSAWAGRVLGEAHRVVISENGSSDGTAGLAESLAAELPNLLAIRSATPGKGGALRRAMDALDADRYLFMDVDLSVDLASAERLLAEDADIVAASRLLPGAEVRRPFGRRLMTAAYGAFSSLALDLGVRDPQCGCKVISRRVRDEILPAVRDDGFFFDTELLARARRSGMTVRELPVRWEERRPGRKSTVHAARTSAEFLKKLWRLRFELP